MDTQKLVDFISGADLDLKLRLHEFGLDPETHADITIARTLLAELKKGVQRGDQSILLGDSWSFSTLIFVLPVIGALETHGFSVLYAT